ncbi:MAG TPA: DUF924 family protein [Hyphomonadaceae bacterium]|nr:DUF924 family protein [Hyphomonadaceae bacterium]
MPENGRIFIDDLEGAPAAPQAPAPGPQPPAAAQPLTEKEDWLKLYRAPPFPYEFPDEDPRSPAYVRTDIDETAGTILHYWFGYAADRVSALEERTSLWFGGGFELDRVIAGRFGNVVARLASGEARRWAQISPRDRLAAIIALDQFSRNIFRDTAAAFENDALAVQLAREAIAREEDDDLKPVERWFLYMPFMHSESATDQRRSLDKFEELLGEATPELRPHMAGALDFARRHAAIIKKFGRFPHRNAILGRTSTSAERKFLAQPGSSF